MSGINCPLGGGHNHPGAKSNYWKDRLPCKEFFAEVLDSAVTNKGSYELFNKYFPNAVSIVHKIIGGDINEC